MKVKVGYMKGMEGIFKEKNNNNRKKTKKMDKVSHDRIVGMFKGGESEVNQNSNQYQRVAKNKSS